MDILGLSGHYQIPQPQHSLTLLHLGGPEKSQPLMSAPILLGSEVGITRTTRLKLPVGRTIWGHLPWRCSPLFEGMPRVRVG